MKISKHVFVQDQCIFCGGYSFPKLQKMYQERGLSVPTTDERNCVPREDGVNSRDLRPEPTLRTLAADDADTISRRMVEIDKDRITAINTIIEDTHEHGTQEVDYTYCMKEMVTITTKEPADLFVFLPLDYEKIASELMFNAANFPMADEMAQRLEDKIYWNLVPEPTRWEYNTSTNSWSKLTSLSEKSIG